MGVFCALSCFVCFGLPYLFSPLHHIKETIWQLHNMPKHYTVNGQILVKVTDQVAMQLVYQMFRRAPARSNQSSLDA